MDKYSLQKIEQLHPMLRESALNILSECECELKGRAKVRFISTHRSDSEQDGLYALGRTKVNPNGKSKERPLGYKVTNAKGGQSIHNFALAVDIVLIIDGKTYSWNDFHDFDGDEIFDWMEVVRIFKKHGWEWGGDWSSFVDKPHFQKTFGLTLKQLQMRRTLKQFISGTSYVLITGTTTHNEFTVTDGLNLRTGRGTEFPVIVVIPSGSKVIQLTRIGDWSEVNFGPKRGWVSNKFLKQ